MRQVVLIVMLIAGCATKQELNQVSQDLQRLDEKTNRRLATIEDSIRQISSAWNSVVQKIYDELGKIRTDIGGLYLQQRALEEHVKYIPPGEGSLKEVTEAVKYSIESLKKGEAPEVVYLEQNLEKHSPGCISNLFYCLHNITTGEKDMILANNLKKLIAQFPAEHLKQVVPGELSSPVKRLAVIEIIRLKKDKGLSKLLEQYQDSTDQELRFLVATTLIECQNEVGIQLLIDFLTHEKEDKRWIAYEQLSKVFPDLFGYKPYAAMEENQVAITKLKEWFSKNRGNIFK